MEALGGYHELSSPARELGSAGFILLLCITALLERLQFKLRATESRTWWASNGRDVLNAIALGAMSAGLFGLGFTGPIAVCIAATVVVLLTALQGALAERRHADRAAVLTALALGAPVLIVPQAVHGFFRALLELLFPLA